MKRTLNIVTLIFLLFAGAFAQQNNDWAQPVHKLEQRIRFLERIAQRYHVQQAINALQNAGSKLDLARSQFQRFQFVKAWLNFNKAKQIVDKVERAVLFKPAVKAFMDAEHLIQRAEHLLQNSQDKQAQYMLNRARSFLGDAEKAYRNGQFVRGQEFQRIAIFFANKAIAFTQGAAAGPADQFNFDEQLRNLRTLYQSVQEQAQENPQIQKLLKNADAFLKQAEKLYRQGKYQRALVQLQIGERLLYRAIDMGQQTEQGQKGRMENNLQSLNRYLTSLETNAQGNLKAMRLLRKARQFLRSARRAAVNGKYQQAANQIDLAQRLANRALRYLNAGAVNAPGSFDDRLQEVNHLYASLSQSAALAQDEYTQYFSKRARQVIKQAQQAHEAGREQLAMARLNFAVRILNRLMSHQSTPVFTSQQIQDLQVQYQRLARVLERFNNQESKTILEKELQQAGQQLQQEHYQIAGTLLDLLQKEINTLIRRAQNR